MSIESKKGRTKEKKKKMRFISWKRLFLFLLFYNYSFALLFKDKLESLS
jgi:hypothetical protein